MLSFKPLFPTALFTTVLLLPGTVVSAQTTIDNSTATILIPGLNTCHGNCIITGGDLHNADTALFHSFSEFLSNPGNDANILINSPSSDVRNVFLRVTGNQSTTLNGRLQLFNTNNANLFLINPNGISFGSNARISLGGSFFATTASSLRFGNQIVTTNATTIPALTTSFPSALVFGAGSGGPITNAAQGGFGSHIGNSLDLFGGLDVNGDQTIGFIGGDLTFNEGRLTLDANGAYVLAGMTPVQNGGIELGSINGTGEVTLTDTGTGLITADYSGISGFGNVSLSNGAVIDASNSTITVGGTGNFGGNGGGGSINVRANNLTVQDSAIVSTSSGLAGRGVTVTVDSTLSLSGSLTNGGGNTLSAFIGTQTEGAGNSGSVSVAAGTINLSNSGTISALTAGRGNAGSVNISAANSITLNSNSIIDSSTPSPATGQGGNVSITTPRLNVLGGSQISTSTGRSGNAGVISLSVADTITISGAGTSSSGVFSQVNGSASGNGGAINVRTGTLNIRGGGQISSAAQSAATTGNGGAVDINATTVNIDSGSGSATSGIFASTAGAGRGGSIGINMNTMTLNNGATVSAQGTSTGDAGNIDISGVEAYLYNDSSINASTASGAGGNINVLLTCLLLLRHLSQISTTAGTANAPGNGGNITIESPLVVGLENSDITSNSFLGRGGFIQITAQGIFGLEVRSELTPENDITAISLFSPQLNGEVVIQTPDIDPTQGLNEDVQAQNPDLVSSGCGAGQTASQGSSLIEPGFGGIPQVSPDVSTDNLWEDSRPIALDNPQTEGQGSSRSTVQAEPRHQPIREAQGWQWHNKESRIISLDTSSEQVVPSSVPYEPQNQYSCDG